MVQKKMFQGQTFSIGTDLRHELVVTVSRNLRRPS